DAALRRFLDDRDELERALGRAVADDAVERARRCLRRGELGRALSHASRALAYAPGHRGAEAALAGVSSRGRWLRVAAVAAAVIVAGGGGALAVRSRRARPQPAVSSAAHATSAAVRAAAPVAPAAPPAELPRATVVAPVAPPPSTQ